MSNIDIRVADLTLNLDIDASENDKAVRLRKVAEGSFIRSLLAACEEDLTRRMGSRAALVFIRYVQVDWDFPEEMLSEGAFAKTLGCELAAGLFGQIHSSQTQQSPLTWPKKENDSVVFIDQAHYEAGYLAYAASESAGPLPWYFSRIAKKVVDPWSLLVRSPPSHQRVIVQYLRQYRTLPSVLRSCPDHLRSSLAQLTGALSDEEVATLAESQHNRSVVEDKQVFVDSLVEEDSKRRESSDATGADPEILEIPQAPTNPPSIPPEQSTQSAASYGLIRPSPFDISSSHTEAPPPPSPPPIEVNKGSKSTRLPSSATNTSIASPLLPVSSTSPDAAQRITDEEPTIATGLHSEYGGLVYLLARALELDLGEHLWCAGVVEAQVFHRIPQAILGPNLPAGDSARGMLSGLWGQARSLSIEAWAGEEIRTKLHASWERETKKHNQRPVPSWLVPTQLAFRLHSVDSDSHTDDCIRYCAATLLSLFLRCRGDEFLPDITDCFRSPARIELSSELMRVHLHMDSVDMRLRRAGLDFDPGWIPWMKR
ncbi:MAG: hypothetical protein JKY56_14290, partial [Kofleriaceae bacterium]|nr:hypothetical protein [Kofleriaceae bacterium]